MQLVLLYFDPSRSFLLLHRFHLLFTNRFLNTVAATTLYSSLKVNATDELIAVLVRHLAERNEELLSLDLALDTFLGCLKKRGDHLPFLNLRFLQLPQLSFVLLFTHPVLR